MSQSLRSMNQQQREQAIYRRIHQPVGHRGLGFWGAIDALKKKK